MFEEIDVLAQYDSTEQEGSTTTGQPLIVDFNSEEVPETNIVSQPSQSSSINQISSPFQNVLTSDLKTTKTVLPKFLLHAEPSQQPVNGAKVITIILKIVERRGYENCLTLKKKGEFFKSINEQLHADDGPLSDYKKTNWATFMKKVNGALLLLENENIITHSAGTASQGEEYPEHLKEMIILYKKVKEGCTVEDNPTMSEINLARQVSILPEVLPASNHKDVDRHSSRAKNKKDKHDLVERGDNSHHASKKEIVEEKKSTPFQNKKNPNFVDMINSTRDTSSNFVSMMEDWKKGSVEKEDRHKKNDERRFEMSERKEQRKISIDTDRIFIEKRRLEIKSHQQSMDVLSKGITMASEEIVLFTDEPELKNKQSKDTKNMIKIMMIFLKR